MAAAFDLPGPLVFGGVLLLVGLLVALLQFLRGLGKLAARKEPLTPADALPSNRSRQMQTNLKLLVQLPLTERFGSAAEQASYARVAQALGRDLTGDERGTYGGALIARGVQILTVVNVMPTARESALVVVLRALEVEGLLDSAIVVLQEKAPDDPSPRCSAVWPENYDGPFYQL